MDMIQRPRRLRGSEKLRKIGRETRMDKSSLVYPMFVAEGTNVKEEIPSWQVNTVTVWTGWGRKLEELADAGVGSVMLFGIPGFKKDEAGSQAYAQDGIVQKAFAGQKKFVLSCIISVMSVCVNIHPTGIAGVLCGHEVDNDKTLELLAKKKQRYPKTGGADMVAPSDMMDGRVAAIRNTLMLMDLSIRRLWPILQSLHLHLRTVPGCGRFCAGI